MENVHITINHDFSPLQFPWFCAMIFMCFFICTNLDKSILALVAFVFLHYAPKTIPILTPRIRDSSSCSITKNLQANPLLPPVNMIHSNSLNTPVCVLLLLPRHAHDTSQCTIHMLTSRSEGPKADPKGLQLGVGATRAPRLLVLYILL